MRFASQNEKAALEQELSVLFDRFLAAQGSAARGIILDGCDALRKKYPPAIERCVLLVNSCGTVVDFISLDRNYRGRNQKA